MITMKISIVIPVFNAKEYLERCLDSILSQEYEDYEAIMVNDGSTDGSADICLSYCKKDARFKYIYQENSGPDIARKTGTDASDGEWLLYVDADDHISDKMLATMSETAVESDADIVCCQIVRFNENREWNGSRNTGERIKVLNNKKDIYRAFFVTEELIGTYYAKLIRRSIMDKYDFIKDGLIGEDITAALYMFDKANTIAVIPDKLYFYYQNRKSISHAKYSFRHMVSLNNYICLRDEMIQKNEALETRICGYFAGYQMAVATAMGRNGSYEKDAGELLRRDLKDHWESIKKDKKTSVFMKCCILLYNCLPKVFVGLFRILYLLTGR